MKRTPTPKDWAVTAGWCLFILGILAIALVTVIGEIARSITWIRWALS